MQYLCPSFIIFVPNNYTELNCGDIAKSPAIKVYNPEAVPVSTDRHQLLLANEEYQNSTAFFRILHYSEETTYLSVFKDVEEDVKSGRLAGVILFSQVDDKVQSKALRPPVNFFNADRDSNLSQIPVIGITHLDAVKLLPAGEITNIGNGSKGVW